MNNILHGPAEGHTLNSKYDPTEWIQKMKLHQGMERL
jgi:hypothetical protein